MVSGQLDLNYVDLYLNLGKLFYLCRINKQFGAVFLHTLQYVAGLETPDKNHF